jgi:hypothetical protein
MGNHACTHILQVLAIVGASLHNAHLTKQHVIPILNALYTETNLSDLYALAEKLSLTEGVDAETMVRVFLHVVVKLGMIFVLLK